MLNSETKRKIDSARNILVGKVTNPISQVDQITNALIYKFMDDMDQENLEVDLKPQFFVGDYAQYSWSKLLDKRLSGQERFNLYEEATKKMALNKNIPQLFRNIFKDARLPYNDPRVLSLFLKEINEFSYSHSEELGNAFEYLLSILGSQGDAGQFRTPRHIIDFIAEVVDPKKNETILDPACGTAGFLISAYKHILKNHDGIDNKTGKPTNKETNLTPEEKIKLMNNISGYDISDEMVKLSLVNMFLHGFQNPNIFVYDTLSSEKRWDEQFDVIMANPPFMTPKGGIKPHKRFSIQANRAEVLFVDYIMEHLSIKGRAGIIAPEGIIFKGDKAYKALRKKLVEDGLFAVVSLPAGIFQPYSGVKTSILLFDNQIAKQTDEILFVKVENDGFDLGAQRRKIDKNDLPKALELIQKYKESLNNKDVYLTGRDVRENNILLVAKSEIAQSGDYNLTIDKYRKDPLEYLQNIINIKDIQKSLQPSIDLVNNFVKSSAFLQLQENLKKMTEQYQNLLENSQIKQVIALQKKFTEELKKRQKWEMVELGEVLEYEQPTKYIVESVNYDNSFKTPVLTAGKTFILGYTNEKEGIMPMNKLPVIIFDDFTTAIKFVDFPFKVKSSAMKILHVNREKADVRFLFQLMKTIKFRHDDHKRYWISEFSKIKIPLPPLSVQKEIVEQIEVKQNAINHARKIIKNLERERRYFGKELRRLEGVEWVELGEVCEFINGRAFKPKDWENKNSGGSPIIRIQNLNNPQAKFNYYSGKVLDKLIVNNGDLLFSWSGSRGTSFGPHIWNREKSILNQHIFRVVFSDKKYIKKFLYYALKMSVDEVEDNLHGGVGLVHITKGNLEKIKIPLPSIAIQKQLVTEAGKEEEIITANKKLIEIMEQKIKKVISEI